MYRTCRWCPKVRLIAEHSWHTSDDDHGDLHDGTQEVKAERLGDASSHRFGAKKRQAISTLLTSP
jgi:hypothetical protein